MTVFYNKRLGDIVSIVDGEQDMRTYGKEQKDYEKIHDFIVVPFNGFVHKNIEHFKVINSKLEMDGDFLNDFKQFQKN